MDIEKKENNILESVDWENRDDINAVFLEYLTDIISLKTTDITDFLVFLNTLYLKEKYSNIDFGNIILLQYIYYNMLDGLNIPLYKNMINSIITYHLSRIVKKMHLSSNCAIEDFAEQDTQKNFDL